MNCRGYRQRFLPLPDLSRKIEGDSVRRVVLLDLMYASFRSVTDKNSKIRDGKFLLTSMDREFYATVCLFVFQGLSSGI